MTHDVSLEQRSIGALERLEPGFTRAAVERLSAIKNEPDWLRARRLEAWAAYERLPMPSAVDDDWKRTDISRLELDSFAPYGVTLVEQPSLERLPASIRGAISEGAERAGQIVQQDSGTVFYQVAADLAKRGVIFMPLDRAVREHPDLVREHLMTNIFKPGDNKFGALHAAFWSGGTFLYVPAGVDVELPIEVLTWSSEPSLAVFPHTLVIVERNASAKLIEDYASAESSSAALSSGVVEIHAKDGANVRYVNVQGWSKRTFHFATVRCFLERDAQVQTLMIAIGGQVSKVYVESGLRGQGAYSLMSGLMFGDETQHFDHQTLQDHVVGNTTSDLLYKSALTESAKSVYSGLIRIWKNAQRSNAYQANRNLLLSHRAKADSIPMLEIEANDVRCTHGATVGPVDPEQLFYLRARGIPKDEAQRLIVEGFILDVMERIPDEAVRDRVHALMTAKLRA